VKNLNKEVTPIYLRKLDGTKPSREECLARLEEFIENVKDDISEMLALYKYINKEGYGISVDEDKELDSNANT
jgi:hypothetical protein